MAVVSTQAPLPVVPAEAIEISDALALVEDGVGGRLYLHGMLAWQWDAEDQIAKRLGAVQMLSIRAAQGGQIAWGFGVSEATLWRWRKEHKTAGTQGLVLGQRGPKGPTKLTSELIDQVHARRQAGQSLRAIGEAVGVSEFSVRRALKTTPDATLRTTLEAGACRSGGVTAAEDSQAQGSTSDDGHDTQPGGQPDQGLMEQVLADQGLKDHGTPDQGLVEPGQEPGGAVEQPAGGTDSDALELLVQPTARGVERGLAQAGLLGEASPVFTAAARVPLAGMLAALPGIEATGLLECATEVYDRLPQGFYGLETVLLEAVFRTLAGEPRAEGAGRFSPADLGRVLGMDRAPEVKTIRRKLAQLGGQGKAAELLGSMASRHLDKQKQDTAEQAGLVLYVDGHVRAYQGTKKIGKTHSPRLRFPAPATVETWVSDAEGDPVLVVMAEPGASLAGELRRLLPQLRAAVGDDRPVLVGFDRGGWSPALFAHMQAHGFDVLTWRKGPTEDIASKKFVETVFTDDTGIEHHWNLADTTVELPIKDAEPVRMRQITRLDTKKAGKPRQAHILTTRQDLTAGDVVYRMGSRWRQENYFRYGRMHLDLDSHDSYRSTADDPARMVPNPAKREANNTVKAAQARAEREKAAADAGLLAARTPAAGETDVLITSDMHNQITAKWRAALDALDTAGTEHALTPARIPLDELAPEQQVMAIEPKLLTHAVKIAAFNTTTAMARAIRIHTSYPRARHEAFTLARKVLTHTGDIDPRVEGELTIRLDPMPTARETAAVAELCDHLTATQTTFPGTDRVLRYHIKPAR